MSKHVRVIKVLVQVVTTAEPSETQVESLVESLRSLAEAAVEVNGIQARKVDVCREH